MTETVHGTITLPDTVDITDPGYDEDVWCRINDFPIEPGEYECYTVTAGNDETDGWGNRIARIGIRKGEADHYEVKGMIGVDSGMAGFFNCDNRVPFEEFINIHTETNDVYFSDVAFFSSSGYGDGGYYLYAGYDNGKIVDIYIEFIEEEE